MTRHSETDGNVRDSWDGKGAAEWLLENVEAASRYLGVEFRVGSLQTIDEVMPVYVKGEMAGTCEKVIAVNQYGTSDDEHFGLLISLMISDGAPWGLLIADTISEKHKVSIEFINQIPQNNMNIFALEESLENDNSGGSSAKLKLICAPRRQ